MRPTLRLRLPWREVGSRLARYGRASHARLALQDPAASPAHGDGDGDDDDSASGSASGSALAEPEPEAEVWSPELVRALRSLEQHSDSAVVEDWLPRLPRPDGAS